MYSTYLPICFLCCACKIVLQVYCRANDLRSPVVEWIRHTQNKEGCLYNYLYNTLYINNPYFT